MNTKFLLFISFSIIYLLACTSTDKTLYEFKVEKLKENEMTLQEIAEDITYIPLDNSILLHMVTPPRIVDGAIYVWSADNGILVFNMEGNFAGRIGSMGGGPGEYLRYGGFGIDGESKRVYVLDGKGIIKVFSETGRFIRSFPLTEYGDAITNIEFFDPGIFVKYSIQFRTDYEWIICDTLGNIIKKQNRHLPEFTANWGAVSPVYKFEDRLFYYSPFADTIFSILPDLTEMPSFTIAAGEYRYPRSDLSLEEMLAGKYLDIAKIFETKRFFVMVYNHTKKHYLALIDKHNQEPFLIRFEYNGSGRSVSGGIVNDLDGGTWFFPESYLAEGGIEYLVGLQDPYRIKAWVESDEFRNSVPKYPEKKKEFERLAQSLKETDNPVIVMVRLKK